MKNCGFWIIALIAWLVACKKEESSGRGGGDDKGSDD
jgi:hypothetical protein